MRPGGRLYTSWLTYALTVYLQSLAAFALLGLVPYLLACRVWSSRFSPPPPRQLWRELVISMLNLMLWSAAACSVHMLNREFGFPYMLFDLPNTPHHFPWYYYPIWFVLMLLLVDAAFYWTHRALHDVPWLRRAHGLHHGFTRTSAGSAYSFNPIEGALLAFTTVFLPYIFAPLDVIAAICFNCFAVMWAAFLHSGWRDAGWAEHPWLRYLYSPAHHATHHAGRDGNFGLYFVFWDRFFGTEVRGAPSRVVP